MSTVVNEVTPFAQYEASAGADTFQYTWWIREETDLKVYVDGELVATTDYTVSGTQTSTGGDVVFDTPLTGGEIVTISTDYPFERLTGFATSGSLRAAALNLELSYLIACILQLQRDTLRTLRLSSSSETDPTQLILPDPEDGKALVWNGIYGSMRNSDVSIDDLDTALATATAQATVATTQAGIATTGANTATTQAGIATTGATTATTKAAEATASATSAAASVISAFLASQVANNLYNSMADGLSRGVVSTTALVGGSGGTNGTFELIFSGGGGSNAAGVFTVVDGSVTSITITSRGVGYTSAPTISFANSSGLTGASATAVIGFNNNVGEYFSVPLTGDASMLVLYRVDAGPSATEVARYPSSAALTGIFADYSSSLTGYLHAFLDAANRRLFAIDLAGKLDSLQIPSTDIGVDGSLFALVDNSNRILFELGPDGSVVTPLPSSTEVQNARGSMATLLDRLNVATDSFGRPKQHLWGEWYLRETRQRLRKRLLGESAQLVIATIGDSWTHNRSRWPQPTAQTLYTAYGYAGGGWTGFADGTGSLLNANVDNSRVGLTFTGTWDISVYTTSTSPDIGQRTATTTAAAAITGQASTSAVTLYYIGTGGQVRYRYNGSAWTTITLSGSGLQTVDLTANLPAIAFTLDIEWVSGTATLCGVDIKSTTDGVRWHKLGSTGSRTSQWAAVDATQWQSGITALAPNLVVIMHGTNDQSAYDAATYATHLTTIVQRVRAAVPLADILIMVPCENGRANARSMSTYAAAAYGVAVAQKCAYLDLQYVFGESYSEYGHASARAWFNADTIHPEPLTGGRVIVDAFTRLVNNL